MLWKGEKVLEGPTAKVVEEYHQRVVAMIKVDQEKDAARDRVSKPKSEVEITSVQFIDKNGVPTDTIQTGDPMTVRVNYNASRRVQRPQVAIDVEWAAEDTLAATCDTQRDGETLAPIEAGKGYVDCKWGPVLMEPNVYSINVRILDGETDKVLGSSERNRFILNEQVEVYGLFGLPHTWEHPHAGEQAAVASCDAAA
jgi:hypothetical protein